MTNTRCNDWSGQKIGDYEIVEKTEEQAKSGKYKYKVKCTKCGLEKTVLISTVKRNSKHACKGKEEEDSVSAFDVDLDNKKYIHYIDTDLLYKIQQDDDCVIGFACYNSDVNLRMNFILPQDFIDTNQLNEFPEYYITEALKKNVCILKIQIY